MVFDKPKEDVEQPQTPPAVTPDIIVRSGSLVSKTTHNNLVYNNPGPLGAVLTAKKGFTAL